MPWGIRDWEEKIVMGKPEGDGQNSGFRRHRVVGGRNRFPSRFIIVFGYHPAIAVRLG
jgi:hypothetical protein